MANIPAIQPHEEVQISVVGILYSRIMDRKMNHIFTGKLENCLRKIGRGIGVELDNAFEDADFNQRKLPMKTALAKLKKDAKSEEVDLSLVKIVFTAGDREDIVLVNKSQAPKIVKC